MRKVYVVLWTQQLAYADEQEMKAVFDDPDAAVHHAEYVNGVMIEGYKP